MQRIASSRTGSKTLVLLLDADGCIYNAEYRARVKDKLERYYPRSNQSDIEETNLRLFSKVIELCQTGQYHQVVIMCGSNRLCYKTDWHNARKNKTGLFHLDLPQIKCIITKMLKANGLDNIEVVSDLVLLADIQSNLLYGSSQERVVEAAADQTKQVLHAAHTFDNSKLIWHYFVFHHVGCCYGETDIAYFDDTESILNDLIEVNHSFHLVPSMVSIAYHYYNGLNLRVLDKMVQGDCCLDENYHQTTLSILQKYQELAPLFQPKAESAILCGIHREFLQKRDQQARKAQELFLLHDVATTLFTKAKEKMTEKDRETNHPSSTNPRPPQ